MYQYVDDISFSVMIFQILIQFSFSLFNLIYKIPSCYMASGNLTNFRLLAVQLSNLVLIIKLFHNGLNKSESIFSVVLL